LPETGIGFQLVESRIMGRATRMLVLRDNTGPLLTTVINVKSRT
jgi:hypothetical protein